MNTKYRKRDFFVKKGSLLQTIGSQNSSFGFTLLEVLVVIVMIGILSTIAAPSWIAFTSQRKVNAVNDSVMRAIQQAQTEAKKYKRRYSISFKTQDSTPQYTVHLATDTNPTNWQFLAKGSEVKPGQVLLGTNLNNDNNAATSVEYNPSSRKTIVFDYTGNLLPETDIGEKGLIVSVAMPQTSNGSQPLTSTIRCVKVITLLGTFQTAKETECNAQ